MLHLLINAVSRYTLFFQLPKPFKFDINRKTQILRYRSLHYTHSKVTNYLTEGKRTAEQSTIQTEASKKVTCIIDSYFVIYMCCTFISISIYIIHIIRLVCISGTTEHRGWGGKSTTKNFAPFIRGWALAKFSSQQDKHLFELGANLRLGA